jgi:putative lipoic acid-binding regulatory protein
MTDTPDQPDGAATRPSLIDFPSHFPIKVMGKMQDDFAETIVTVVRDFDPNFDASTIEMRPSRNGNYLGLTVNVWVTSQAQLDDLYRALSSHPMVSVVL